MKKESIQNYIFLGTSIRYLQDAQNNWIIKSAGAGAYILDNIDMILKSLDRLELFVTRRAAYELEDYYNKLSTLTDRNELNSSEAQELRNIINRLRPTFEAECSGKYALITVDKRFTIEKLTEKIELLFAPGTFTKLPLVAQFDFKEAGLCIAYERSTAAAFHILRGTEDVIRSYYGLYFKEKIVNKTWGLLTNELKNKNRGKKPDPIIINHLINIKDSFRNPTQHPDKNYDIEEAQDLLSLCIDVTNRMAKHFK